jgi:hypothetical protein
VNDAIRRFPMKCECRFFRQKIGYKLEEKFFKAFSPKGRLDDTKQGFASYVGKRFNPLLRSEVKHAETAYNILMSERTVPISQPAIGNA